MNGELQFELSDIIPDADSILQAQGVSAGSAVPEKIRSILQRAMDRARRSINPIGILSDISIEEFASVFRGENCNDPETPIGNIFPRADRLALFAATLGGEVSREIEMLFKGNDLALAALLDAAASLAADRMVDVMEDRFYDDAIARGMYSEGEARSICALSYSPGYCGWHISGQKRLFEYLKPERIGISLTESFLMIPLKSVTGVLIVGRREIHLVENKYPFCRQCKSPSCIDRRRRILGE